MHMHEGAGTARFPGLKTACRLLLSYWPLSKAEEAAEEYGFSVMCDVARSS